MPVNIRKYLCCSIESKECKIDRGVCIPKAFSNPTKMVQQGSTVAHDWKMRPA